MVLEGLLVLEMLDKLDILEVLALELVVFEELLETEINIVDKLVEELVLDKLAIDIMGKLVVKPVVVLVGRLHY